jgi:hypothetical protein
MVPVQEVPDGMSTANAYSFISPLSLLIYGMRITYMIFIDVRSACGDQTHPDESSREQRAFGIHVAIRAWDLRG